MKSTSDEKEKQGIYDSDLSDDTTTDDEGLAKTPKKYLGFMGFGAPKRRADGQNKIIGDSKKRIPPLKRGNAVVVSPQENSRLDFFQNNPGPSSSKKKSDLQEGGGLPPVKKLKMMNLNYGNEETCLIPRGNSEHEICIGWEGEEKE